MASKDETVAAAATAPVEDKDARSDAAAATNAADTAGAPGGYPPPHYPYHPPYYAHPGGEMAPPGQPMPGHMHPPPPYMGYGYPGAEHVQYPPQYPPQYPSYRPDEGNSGVVAKSGSDWQGGQGSQTQDAHDEGDGEFKVYNSRWIMLGYMAMLNLLSDWTCYSVAPIALLTKEAFGDVNPEILVTVFLGANAMASAAEPAILGRLGLRKTVVFGAMLLMVGSIIKSGGVPLVRPSVPTQSDGNETWKLYMGFFLVGLSQPLYQCTPALLSSSWFPENERTMATGIALNSNQLGIGCAFVFGTLLVATVEDILPYFGLLSVISTIAFVGAALQFEDAPPTPPSDTARVIRGTLEIKIPNWFGKKEKEDVEDKSKSKAKAKAAPTLEAAAPAPAPTEEPTRAAAEAIAATQQDLANEDEKEDASAPAAAVPPPHYQGHPYPYPPHMYMPYGYPPPPPGASYPPSYGMPPQGHAQQQHDENYRGSSLTHNFYHGYDQEGHYHNEFLYQSELHDDHHEEWDDGVEPIMTQTDNHLDIDIRDDQIIQQFKACFARPGFSHCVVAFTTSGIIINTLSTFMDYLVTLEGGGREYVGIVGGTFQALIMVSSLIFGGLTDKSRKYYSVTLAMLVLGAFALAMCNVNLDADAGGDLRLNLLIVGILAGPLQPISTELGVEVVYPLSENTVLVIQQLFSNLLSAAFIPVFKMLRDVGTDAHPETQKYFEVPQYTFSFYLLIVIHACSTLYFASFNGRYLRNEAELEKKANKENRALLSSNEEETHNASYGAVGIN